MDDKSKEKEWLRRVTGRQSGENKNDNVMEERGTTKETTYAERRSNGAATQKKLYFKDVAGMDELKRFITEGFINVLNNREWALRFGLTPPSILLYGPSGCGKTFFAEILANEVGVNFIKVVPDDIASKWLHGTQEKISEIFKRAERESPTILFFDEFDAMVPKRTEDDKGNQNGEVNEFLCMLNNASERGIYVIAATNHPECIDRAVLRTGRFDEMIYVDMPDKEMRASLFRISLAKLPADDDIDYERLAELTAGYNCSDISNIVKTASRKVFNVNLADKMWTHLITQQTLEEVIAVKAPSLTKRDLSEFERLRGKFSQKQKVAQSYGIGFM